MPPINSTTPNEPGKILPKDEATALVWDSYVRARDVVHSLREQWQSSYELYRSYIEDTDDSIISELALPLIFSHVETYLPNIAQANPIIQTWARTEDEAERIRAAKHRNLLLYDWDILNMQLKIIETVKSAEIYGTAILKTNYRIQEQERLVRTLVPEDIYDDFLGVFQLGSREVPQKVKRKVTVYDDPECELLDLDEVFPDPDGWDIDTCEYIIHEIRGKSFYDLENALNSEGEPLYNQETLRELGKLMQSDNPRDSEDEASLRRVREEMGSSVSISVDPHKRQFTLLEWWSDDKVITIVKEHLDLPPLRNDYNELGRKPFVRYTPIILPKEFYGLGIPEILYSLNLELSTIHGATIDNLIASVHKMYKVLVTSNLNTLRQIRYRPGGTLLVDTQNDIEPLRRDSTEFSIFRESDELRRFAQAATGANDTLSGLRSDLTGGTATESNLLHQQGSKRSALMFKVLGWQTLIPLGRQLTVWNENNISDDKVFKIMGDDFSQETFERVKPEDIISRNGLDIGIRIDIAQSEPENRQFRLNRAVLTLQTLRSLEMPLEHPLVERALLELAEGLGATDNPRKLIEEGREVIARARQAAVEAENAKQTGQTQAPPGLPGR